MHDVLLFFPMAGFSMLIFVKDFCVCIHEGHWYVIFFSCTTLVKFWYQGYAGFIKQVVKHFLFYFLRRIYV